jgi:DNA polymerase elongation subunit (family B)
MRKTLTLDIETSPHLCYSFQTWNTNIMPVQVIDPTRVVSVAAKWQHKKKVIFLSEYEGFAPVEGMTREECHLDMVQQVFDLMDEADVVVTYNGDKFDLPHLAREFHLAFGPQKKPSPYASVDLYKVIKKNEVWLSHKLAYITSRLRLSGKMDNSGWALWKGILSEDPEVRDKAWREMRRYNPQDVRTTEELLEECLPYINNLPNPALFEDTLTEDILCACGSDQVQRRGFAVTKTRRYPRYQCQSCGKWFRDVRSAGSVGTT